MPESIQNNSGPQPPNWPNSRKLLLGVVALLCVGVFGAIIMQARDADYQLLFANMATEDGAEIVRWLKDQKIPYRLENAGAAIYIPANQVYEARLQLAGAGMPKGGGVGFEIFDKQSFGMTDFSQKVNYLRALQGELSRTISSLAPVTAARVHLVMPEKRVFQAQQKKTTASVILKLTPGLGLDQSQIMGIINLVAGSIEGLKTDQVTIVDSSGRILSRPKRDEVAGLTTPGLLEYQAAMEQKLETRAQSLLDRALGSGNSVVRVTANVDFTQQEETEERYDPEGSVIRSEQTTEGSSVGQVAGGVPGVTANLKDEGQTAASAPGSNQSEGTINYEVSKVVSRKIMPVGTLKNLSVAVLVAYRQVAVESAEGLKMDYIPREAKELTVIANMVRSALGIDLDRGDKFEIESLPFESGFEALPLNEPTEKTNIYQYLPFIKYGMLALALLFSYLLLVRPILKTLLAPPRLETPFKTVGELEAEMLEGHGEQKALPEGNIDIGKNLREQAISQKAPYAQIIKSWLQEG